MLRPVALITSIALSTLLFSSAYAGGEGRWHPGKSRHGGWLVFNTVATGAQEVNGAGGVETDRLARATAIFDPGFTRVRIKVRLNDSENVTAVHFHCARAGENGPVAFGLISPGPLGLENGTIRGTLTNADATGADCMASVDRPVNNIASLAMAMREGLIYLNIHTSENPAGEVRGQMLERN